MFSVYTLADPRTNQVRYVGISCNVEQRYIAHLHTDPHNLTKREWVRELKNNQLIPTLAILEIGLTFEDAKKHELKWIRHHLEQGMPLVNISGVTKPWVGGVNLRKKPKPEPVASNFLTVTEAAEQLHLSVDTIKRKLRSCEIPGFRIGVQWRVAISDVEEIKKTQQRRQTN